MAKHLTDTVGGREAAASFETLQSKVEISNLRRVEEERVGQADQQPQEQNGDAKADVAVLGLRYLLREGSDRAPLQEEDEHRPVEGDVAEERREPQQRDGDAAQPG